MCGPRLYGDARLRAAAGPGMPGPYRTMILKSAKSRSYAFSAQLRLYLHFLCAHISGVTGTAP